MHNVYVYVHNVYIIYTIQIPLYVGIIYMYIYDIYVYTWAYICIQCIIYICILFLLGHLGGFVLWLS